MSKRKALASVETCGWCRREREIYTYDSDDKPVCWECHRKFISDMTGVDPDLYEGWGDE